MVSKTLQSTSVTFPRHSGDSCPEEILRHLPAALRAEITRLWDNPPPEELRLRLGTYSCLCRGGETVPLGTVLTPAEMDRIVNSLCGGSMYAHRDTLRRGYLTLRGGIRVGVCGEMREEGGQTRNICRVTSLIFRIPRPHAVPTDTVCRLLCAAHPGRGTLIYSPPGIGKTTLLRALIVALASPPYRLRLAVIDSRRELAACGTDTACGAEWLCGYPKGEGIEIATRTLAPALIVCDEIGNEEEAAAICAACNAGVPLLATAHGADVVGLLRRPALRRLHRQGIFGSYVGLSRPAGGELRQRVTRAESVCGCD